MTKKAFLLAIVLLSTLTVGAQKEVFSIEGDRAVLIPGELTADGKARLYIRNRQENGGDIYRIYNTKMELETTLEAPEIKYRVSTVYESGYVSKSNIANYDPATVSWNTESQDSKSVTASFADVDDFYNMDSNNFMRDCDIVLTQTLFNNDEDWEFAFKIGGLSSAYYPSTSYSDDDFSVNVRRVRTVYPEPRIEVYNQYGQKVYSIEGDGTLNGINFACIAEGKKYVCTKNNSGDSHVYTQYLVNDSGAAPVNPGKTAIRGDVNEDKVVNGTDIQEVINIIVSGE